MQQWSAVGPGARQQLCVEGSLWDPAVWHSADMTDVLWCNRRFTYLLTYLLTYLRPTDNVGPCGAALTPQLSLVLIANTHIGMARLSWPGWQISYGGCSPARRRSSIPLINLVWTLNCDEKSNVKISIYSDIFHRTVRYESPLHLLTTTTTQRTAYRYI